MIKNEFPATDISQDSILVNDVQSSNNRHSISIRNQFLRVVWNLTWAIFASWTPPSLRLWRLALIRLFGGRVNWSANVYGSVRIWYPKNLVMDRYACLGPRVTCYCVALIHLKPYAVVSQGSHLCTGTHDVDDDDFPLIAKPIVIGRNAWVAADAFVGPGVSLGDGSVLGARGVLFKNAAAKEIYVGNPARRVRERRTNGKSNSE